MTFAQRLRRWRGVKRSVRGPSELACGEKITQAEAAARIGVPLRTYQDWEGGRHEPAPFVVDLLKKRMAIRGESSVESTLGTEKYLKLIRKLSKRKKAGRPVASSNLKAKGTPTGIGTGKKRVINAKGKHK